MDIAKPLGSYWGLRQTQNVGNVLRDRRGQQIVQFDLWNISR